MSEVRYFAARNAPGGFYSYFPEIFSPDTLDLIFIIKGGPGTGKSTMLGKIASAIENSGYKVEYYYCSADPKSLDGIKAPALSAAVLDGTAPHITDARYPGAVERIVNLCEFFDNAALKQNILKIRELCAAQSSLYVLAYSSLRYAGELREELNLLLRECILFDKMKTAARKIAEGYPASSGGSSTVRCVEAVSTKGIVSFDTFYSLSDRRYAVSDSFGAAKLFLSELKTSFCERGIDVLYSPEIDGNYPQSIYIPSYRVCFEAVSRINTQTKENYGKIINTARFTDKKALKQYRNRFRFLNKTRELFIQKAVQTLSRVAPLHNELEQIYSKSVDFSGINSLTEKITSEILGG